MTARTPTPRHPRTAPERARKRWTLSKIRSRRTGSRSGTSANFYRRTMASSRSEKLAERSLGQAARRSKRRQQLSWFLGISGGAGSRLRTRLCLPQTRAFPVLSAETGKSAFKAGLRLPQGRLFAHCQNYLAANSLRAKTGNAPRGNREDTQYHVRFSFLTVNSNAVNKLGRYDVRQNSSPCLERGVGARRT